MARASAKQIVKISKAVLKAVEIVAKFVVLREISRSDASSGFRRRWYRSNQPAPG